MARTILVGALACLALMLAPTAGAQSPRPEHTSSKEYSLNVDEQPLTRALEQLYGQTGVFYGYSPNSPEEEQMMVGPLRGKRIALLLEVGLAEVAAQQRVVRIEQYRQLDVVAAFTQIAVADPG